MAKRPTVEERIDELASLESSPPEPGTLKKLTKSLASKIGLIVEAAANTARSIGFVGADAKELEAAMSVAFATLSIDGPKRDPLCRGKLAIAKALLDSGTFVEEVFSPGSTLVQLEPVWGGAEDTAASLRARCGLAYAELAHSDAVNVLARLLADSQRAARAGAAHALGNSGRLEAIPLLRFKILTADVDSEVHAEALRALVTIDPDNSIKFVGSLLLGPRPAAEAAALCLGESREADAFPILREWVTGDPSNIEVGYLAIALLRMERGTDFLLDEIENGEESAAAAAETALDAFAHDTELASRVSAAKKRRSS